VPTGHGERRRRDDAEAVAPDVAAPMAEAALLAGWIASRLDWKRYTTVKPSDGTGFQLKLEGHYEMVDLRIESEPTDDLVPGELTSVRLRAYGETGAAEFIIDRDGDEATAATNADGMTALLRRMTMETPREAQLLAAQLSSETHDPLYESALHAAIVFLASARAGEPPRERSVPVPRPVQEVGG